MRVDKLKKANFERLSTVKMSLEAIGLKSEPIEKEEIIKLLYNYYNPRLKTETILKADTDSLNLG